ncbi:flagellin [Rhodoferax mekongensis]|uniref:Flagellin n=1 Tax=Rhodoferax mekongensis TaxID=3068341 RepID=A0ABZ0B3Y9_9BURK|nr:MULTISPECIES: flagellin [unclassified Rhodoferax]MDT7514277.1 flagellin [Rhodoferax sp. TBRC 17199]WNO06628.1 flagellin [Rhodoferax sp. TBRC 17307]
MSQSSLSTSMQRLSSGLRINSAKDDAAGLAISDRMTSQIRGLTQAARNSNDAISLTQTAEGALGSISSNLQRIRELAVQSANGTNSASDREAIQNEVTQLTSEINRVATTTQFNGLNLLDGTLTGTQFQVGANANQIITVGVGSAKAADLGNNTLSSNTAAGSISGAVIAAVNNTAAQALTLNGNGTTATVNVAVNESAKSIAGKVNTNTATTGITATAKTTATISGVTAGAISFTLQGANTTAVAISATVSDATDLSAIAKAINAQSSLTNITATSDKAGNLVLTDLEGNDIKIDSTQAAATDGIGTATVTGATGGATAALGTDTATIGGKLTFDAKSGFSIATDTGTTLLAAASNGSSLSTVAALSVSTVTGANSALKVVDAALAQISDQRAALGAVQNRFESTVTNLQTSSENLSASRSRIQDADFAAETANLSRSQILQQAGTAMVAQANQLPQGVLALLR